jgi:replication factor A1
MKMEIKDLQPNSTFDNLDVEVVSKTEPREFVNFRGKGSVATAKIKDETGETNLTLWNEQIEQVKVEDRLRIENGWVKEYRGELQISTGRNGKITVLTD